MSGIVAVVNLNEAPVDRGLLQGMTEYMAFRGPDAQGVWVDGHIGLGHTMLRATRESVNERQPHSLDGQVWITADARVDGRADLIRSLVAHGRTGLEAVPDVELILHAYHVWGEDCVRHLIGDFSFIIWDGRRRCLFCARDQMGVKPFYYAHVGNHLVLSNTLDCVRLHPSVSDDLNDLAIADFLLFDFNQEPATSTFADVGRLPPAHTLSWSEEGLSVRRYWTLPVDGCIRYRRPSEYVDHFLELLRTAVEDRLRTDRVGVFMSGGLDSTSVAALAQEHLAAQPAPFDLRAFTVVYDRLMPDQERHYSGLVADALGIPIDYLPADDYELFQRWNEPELRTPEPDHEPLAALSIDQTRDAAAHGRVALTGYGGDPALYPSQSYFVDLVRDFRFGRLITDVTRHFVLCGRLPRPGFRSRLKRMLGGRPPWYVYPPWLQPALASRLDLPARLARCNEESAPIHPVRPEAYRTLLGVFWPYRFETCDAGVTLLPLEVRHPFFDLRLLNYVLAIPPLPWFLEKVILRQAMRGRLPEPVRRRPKAPLVADPMMVRCRRDLGASWLPHCELPPEIRKYVDVEAVPYLTQSRETAADAISDAQLWLNLRPLSLAHWLQRSALVNTPAERSKACEVTR